MRSSGTNTRQYGLLMVRSSRECGRKHELLRGGHMTDDVLEPDVGGELLPSGLGHQCGISIRKATDGSTITAVPDRREVGAQPAPQHLGLPADERTCPDAPQV